jgi:hypothetical protein
MGASGQHRDLDVVTGSPGPVELARNEFEAAAQEPAGRQQPRVNGA